MDSRKLNEFLSVFNKHALVKCNSSYMTKNLKKEIMLRSRLRNKFLKTKTEESKVAVTGLDKLRARCRLDALGRAKPLRRALFSGRAHFAL